MSGHSLQRRLVLSVAALVGALWLLAAGLTWRDARREVDELLDAHLAQSAALLVALQSQSGETDDDDRLLDTPELQRYSPHVAYQVWHAGALMLRSPNAPMQPMSTQLEGYQTRRIDGQDWRLFATRGAEHDLQVFVGETQSSRSDILMAVLRSLLLPLAMALPLTALGVWLAVRRGLLPLRALSALLTRRRPEQLDAVAVPADAPLELQPMVLALNGLLARIGGLMAAERRFTADAAHELRTPIAGLRAQAQVALDSVDDAERRHALQATLLGCDRASHLVQQLLTLSRLEASGSGASLALLDLAQLARRVAAELAPQALEQGQELSLEAEQACPLAGDEALLGALLRNLIDNALRYSPAQAVVRVEVARRADGSTLLGVEDDGPGMSDAALARLGERFFRVLGSGREGSGLGWSIVRRIAQAHGATVSVDRSPGLGGLRVEVGWPPTPAPPVQAPVARG